MFTTVVVFDICLSTHLSVLILTSAPAKHVDNSRPNVCGPTRSNQFQNRCKFQKELHQASISGVNTFLKCKSDENRSACFCTSPDKKFDRSENYVHKADYTRFNLSSKITWPYTEKTKYHAKIPLSEKVTAAKKRWKWVCSSPCCHVKISFI